MIWEELKKRAENGDRSLEVTNEPLEQYGRMGSIRVIKDYFPNTDFVRSYLKIEDGHTRAESRGSKVHCYVKTEGWTLGENGKKIEEVRSLKSFDLETKRYNDKEEVIERVVDYLPYRDRSFGYRVVEKISDGKTIETQYIDQEGLVYKKIDENGPFTGEIKSENGDVNTYLFGNLIRKTTKDGTEITYEHSGDRCYFHSSISPDGTTVNAVHYDLDDLTLITRVKILPDGTKQEFSSSGSLQRETKPNGDWKTFLYGDPNNVFEEGKADGSSHGKSRWLKYVYNADGSGWTRRYAFRRAGYVDYDCFGKVYRSRMAEEFYDPGHVLKKTRYSIEDPDNPMPPEKSSYHYDQEKEIYVYEHPQFIEIEYYPDRDKDHKYIIKSAKRVTPEGQVVEEHYFNKDGKEDKFVKKALSHVESKLKKKAVNEEKKEPSEKKKGLILALKKLLHREKN